MKIKQIFLSGLKAFIPMVLTIGIVGWAIHAVDAFFGGVLRWLFPSTTYLAGSGILVGIIFVFLLGILVNAWVLKSLYGMLDKWVKKIPFIKSIYNAAQDLVHFFDKESSSGQQTVLVETPMGPMVGFITRDTIKDLPFGTPDSEDVLVYLPLSYQIGGFMIAMPRNKLKVIDWPMDTAMSFVLTSGMTKGSTSS